MEVKAIDLERLVKIVKENNVEITVRIDADGEQEVDIQPHTFGFVSTTKPCIVDKEEQEHD